MSSELSTEALQAENAALRKTVAALTKRMDGMLNRSSTSFDTFAQSVLLQQIVQRRTHELEALTESMRLEAERRRHAEDSMRRERHLLQNVLANIPLLVSWKDLSHTFQGCNQAFARNAGLRSCDEIIGLSFDDLPWHPVDLEQRHCVVQKVASSECAIIDFEEVFVNADGSETTYLASTVPMRDNAGQISGTLSIYTDLTERRRLETQLLQAQKLESIGQLAAGIAHEINTPAQYVADNTRFLQREFDKLLRMFCVYDSQLDPEAGSQSWEQRASAARQVREEMDFDFLQEEIPRALTQSIEGLGRITHIVGAMKSFSHPGSLRKEMVDLNKAIESTVVVCSNRWKYSSDLELQLAPDLPEVPCLLGEFNQVILNLIVNAVDAIESDAREGSKRGKITIITRHSLSSVIIDIRDNGGGIPDKVRDKIFDPFFTTKGVGKGTGQGLAISRNVIVDKHGGTIDCHTTPDRETVFIITLPIADPHATKEAA